LYFTITTRRENARTCVNTPTQNAIFGLQGSVLLFEQQNPADSL
jgi:hypothetical protein